MVKRAVPYLKNLSYCLDELSAPDLATENANKFKNKIQPFEPTDGVYKCYAQLKPEHKEELKQKAITKKKHGKKDNSRSPWPR